MRNGGKKLILTAGCIALTLTARTAVKTPEEVSSGPSESDTLSKDNPYTSIIQRNIFDLHDPPPPPPEKVDKGPPPNIKLTGITTIFGNKQALFIVNELGVGGKPPTTHSVILSENQRAGVLEVIEIDPKGRKATIKSDGVESTLNIETNKVAVTGGGAPPNAGGPPGAHAGAYGTPPGFPHNPGEKGIPARPMRSEGTQNGAQQPNYGSQQNNNYANNNNYAPQGYGTQQYGGNGAIQTPGGALNLGGTAAPGFSQPTASQIDQQLTPAEQAILIEAQRAQSLSGAADPNLAVMLPPTSLSQPQPSQSPSGDSAPPVPTSPGSSLPAALQPRGNLLIPH